MSLAGPPPTAPPPGVTVLRVVEVGLGAAVAVYLYWCLQSGFFGAFSVSLAEVGAQATAPAQMSVGLGFVGAALAGLLLTGIGVFLAVRAVLHRWWPGSTISAVLTTTTGPAGIVGVTAVAAAILLTGLGIQATVDGQWGARALRPAAAILIAWLLVAAGERYGRAQPARLGAARWVVTVLVVVVAGYAVNAWAYQLGLQSRTAHPSSATFLIGRTPAQVDVVWAEQKSAPQGLHATTVYHLVELGRADDHTMLYDRGTDVVYRVADDEVSIVRHPHGKPAPG